ncbi:MAG: hypothetical protein AAFP67_13555 [Pseudomonadota bacterium]
MREPALVDYGKCLLVFLTIPVVLFVLFASFGTLEEAERDTRALDPSVMSLIAAALYAAGRQTVAGRPAAEGWEAWRIAFWMAAGGLAAIAVQSLAFELLAALWGIWPAWTLLASGKLAVAFLIVSLMLTVPFRYGYPFAVRQIARAAGKIETRPGE